MSCHFDKDPWFLLFLSYQDLQKEMTLNGTKFKMISCPQPVKSPPWDMGKGYFIPKVNFVSLK